MKKERLNYFDLNTTEKHWYLHIKKGGTKDPFDAVLKPCLELGMRVWKQGELFEVVSRSAEIFIIKSLEDNHEEKINTLNTHHGERYVKDKVTLVLDSPSNEEIKRLGEVLLNEQEDKQERKTQGSNSLDFKEGTIGEKVYEVIKKYSQGYLRVMKRGLNISSTDELMFIRIKSLVDETEIDWENFPLDKRQDFLNLELEGNVESVRDFFNIRYIYLNFSLKDYLPKEEKEDGAETIL